MRVLFAIPWFEFCKIIQYWGKLASLILIVAPFHVSIPVRAEGLLPPISLSQDMPSCLKATIAPPPIQAPLNYVLARTDLVDWNNDGVCDVAYLFTPREPKARKALGGYAVHLFSSHHKATRWQKVMEMTWPGGSVRIREGVPFVTPGDEYWTGSSHFLLGGLTWAHSPQLGVLLDNSGDRHSTSIARWSAETNGFIYGAGEYEGHDVNTIADRLWLTHRSLRALSIALHQANIDEAYFESNSQDLRILRSKRIVCLLKSDLPCLLHTSEQAATHPAANWDDVGALQDAAQLNLARGKQSGLAESSAFLKQFSKYWKSNFPRWLGWHDAPITMVIHRDAAIQSALAYLAQAPEQQIFSKERLNAIQGYWYRKNFSAFKTGMLPDKRRWEIGLSDAALILRINQNWQELETLPWVDYSSLTADGNECDDSCHASRKYLPPSLWPKSSWTVTGKAISRAFTAENPNSGLVSAGGATIEGDCRLVASPVYFKLKCNTGYSGGTHPDYSISKSFYSRNPTIFGQPVEPIVTCLDARYDSAALTRAWNNLLVTCAMGFEENNKTALSRASFTKWLAKGQEIVGDRLPECNYVQPGKNGVLEVVANTGWLGRASRATTCDQAEIRVPLANAATYIKTHLTGNKIQNATKAIGTNSSRAENLLAEANLDTELNSVYRSLLKAAPRSVHNEIRVKQRAWLVQRDQLIAGEPVKVLSVCNLDCTLEAQPYKGSVVGFLRDRIDELRVLYRRYSAQHDLANNPYNRRLPKCVTPLHLNECDVPIIVKWCWELEGNISDWHSHDAACEKYGPKISRIEPGQELTTPIPLSSLPLRATFSIFESCIAKGSNTHCRR